MEETELFCSYELLQTKEIATEENFEWHSFLEICS